MFGADPMGMSQSLRMVSLPARTQLDGSIFMPKKDSPFLLQIAERMTFRAQFATTLKSRHSRNGVWELGNKDRCKSCHFIWVSFFSL
jgi:hypothetical protein